MTLPKVTREIGAALKAQVATVPAGHAMMQETPDAVLAAVRAALA
jgi:pimeloyl-ACP methyl ester carboxylesterase